MKNTRFSRCKVRSSANVQNTPASIIIHCLSGHTFCFKRNLRLTGRRDWDNYAAPTASVVNRRSYLSAGVSMIIRQNVTTPMISLHFKSKESIRHSKRCHDTHPHSVCFVLCSSINTVSRLYKVALHIWFCVIKCSVIWKVLF